MNITEAMAKNAPVGVLRDGIVKGFHLKVTPAGNRIWMFAFRLKNGERRNPKLGEYPAMNVETARERAREMYLAKEKGQDPTRTTAQLAPDSTLEGIRDRFLATYGADHWGASIQRRFPSLWRLYIGPHLAKLPVATLTWRDVERMIQATGRVSRGSANHCRIFVGLMLQWAEREGLRPDNTSSLRNCTFYSIAPRRRDITRAEFKAILAAMDKVDQENWSSGAAMFLFRLMMLCGCRPSELQLRKREEVHFYKEGDEEHAKVWLPHTKTGRLFKGTTGARWLYLGAEGARLIRQLYARWPQSQWLIPTGRHRDSYLEDFNRPWHRMLAMAGVENLTPKDLRHYYVTYQLHSGVPINAVSAMVGHSNPQITLSVYAHVMKEMERENAASAQAGIAKHFKEAVS